MTKTSNAGRTESDIKIRDNELLRPEVRNAATHATDSATEIYPVELSRKSQRPTRLRRGQTHAILAAQIPRGPPRTSSAYDGNAMRSFPAFLLFVCLLLRKCMLPLLFAFSRVEFRIACEQTPKNSNPPLDSSETSTFYSTDTQNDWPTHWKQKQTTTKHSLNNRTKKQDCVFFFWFY